MFEYVICVGAMKAGTTLLYYHLLEHPQIRTGHKKELAYFVDTEAPDKAEYDALFPEGEGLKLDITPFYLCHEPCIDRMRQILDPAKVAVIAILRDPVDRAFSQYRMRCAQDIEDVPFPQTLALEKQRTAGSLYDLRMYNYFMRSHYAPQVDKLYQTFPKENIRLYLFEDFVKDQQGCMDQVCDFLGISPIKARPMHTNKTVVHVKSRILDKFVAYIAGLVPKGLRTGWMRKLRRKVRDANERKDIKDSIDPAFEKELIELYRGDVVQLRDTYGVDVSKWKHFTHL